MFLLKCTSDVQKVLSSSGTPSIDAVDSGVPLGHWYVNQFVADRRKYFIFMSEKTLLSFVQQKGRKPVTRDTLQEAFQSGLEHLLAMRGFPVEVVEKTLALYAYGVIARTDSRSSLGSMNDLVHNYRHLIEYAGWQRGLGLNGIMMKINEMPQRRLDWSNSWFAVKAMLGPLTRRIDEDR